MTSKKRKETTDDDQDNFSDAETIQYAEPYRDIFTKKDEIYRKKAKKKEIKKLTSKKRKVNTDNEQDNFSDGKTIPYAEPYRNTFTKKDEVYRKKAIKTLTKKKPSAKKAKTIKVVEPKEDGDPELVITGFKPITNPRTRKQLKEKEIACGNSAAVQANFAINAEDFLNVPLLFNLKMTNEMEIEDWLVDNLIVNNDEYYIEHKQGTSISRIRKEPDSESNNSEMLLTNLTINPEDFLNLPLLFNLNMTRESEIEDWLLKNIQINNEEEYYIEHKKGSNLFTVRKPCANSDAVKANFFINPEEFLKVPLLFDLNKTSENEIDIWMVKSIRYWIKKNAPTDNSRCYTDHPNDSNLFVI